MYSFSYVRIRGKWWVDCYALSFVVVVVVAALKFGLRLMVHVFLHEVQHKRLKISCLAAT